MTVSLNSSPLPGRAPQSAVVAGHPAVIGLLSSPARGER